ncbi:unnamed protein product [Gongylonema pulchrum]|uniref:Uncharacterized protein n=1 Tax=Gongylonema pulchrum TaxID=637853 RepID=A0A183DYP3_9BILA|nr:unnamed protein product [Gongylonema pulchrum]
MASSVTLPAVSVHLPILVKRIMRGELAEDSRYENPDIFVPNNLKDQEQNDLSLWAVRKKHFRETEEWKRKKRRVRTKIRAMGRINLALIIARMPVSLRL